MNKPKVDPIVKIIAADIKSIWGRGFASLGDDIQRAVIGERVLMTFTARMGNEGYAVPPQEIHGLYTAVLAHFWLTGDGK